jgi:hypothetical protein
MEAVLLKSQESAVGPHVHARVALEMVLVSAVARHQELPGLEMGQESNIEPHIHAAGGRVGLCFDVKPQGLHETEAMPSKDRALAVEPHVLAGGEFAGLYSEVKVKVGPVCYDMIVV